MKTLFLWVLVPSIALAQDRTGTAAARTGDLDAAAALIDFPVTMMTDDSKGQAKGEPWDREKWTR